VHFPSTGASARQAAIAAVNVALLGIGVTAAATLMFTNKKKSNVKGERKIFLVAKSLIIKIKMQVAKYTTCFFE
jgi:hypothetical protein